MTKEQAFQVIMSAIMTHKNLEYAQSQQIREALEIINNIIFSSE